MRFLYFALGSAVFGAGLAVVGFSYWRKRKSDKPILLLEHHRPKLRDRVTPITPSSHAVINSVRRFP